MKVTTTSATANIAISKNGLTARSASLVCAENRGNGSDPILPYFAVEEGVE
ncbi:MAG: hypothetical protein OEY81_01825 [Candidatus Bathyarchaeota archaeon]|nr:hypothetical protein [Candidatus Bathyarchaeota archaeon]